MIRTRVAPSVVLLLVLAVAAAVGSAPADAVSAASEPEAADSRLNPASSDWLGHVNAFRATAGLPPVREDAALSDGARKHSRYLVLNNVGGHHQDPNNPYYTPEGAQAGRNGVVTASTNPNPQSVAATTIALFMSGPFHALNILDPQLVRVGYGEYTDTDSGPVTRAVTLVTGLGIDHSLPWPQAPVAWPGEAAAVPYGFHLNPEFPNPLTSCPGYERPTGLPLLVQFPTNTNVTASSFAADGVAAEHCVFDAHTYHNPNPAQQDRGRQRLARHNAVVLIPKEWLGKDVQYSASITSGQQTVDWSFTITQADGYVPSTSGPAPQPRDCTGGDLATTPRLAGQDRIETAVAVSGDSFAAGAAEAAVLAVDRGYPDALAGTPLAVAKGGPLLLTPSDRLDERVAQELRRAVPPGAQVYLLGGEAALDRRVAHSVADLGYPVTRLGGADRFETAVVIAEQGLGSPDTVLLATGRDFPDALSAGAAAPALSAAVLLTDGDRMAAATSSYMASHTRTEYAVGGAAARAAPAAERLVGSDRYETATLVAERFFDQPDTGALASGVNFPDALGGGAHVAAHGGPLLLTTPTALPAATERYLATGSGTLNTVFLYGGTAAVSEAVRTCAAAAIAR